MDQKRQNAVNKLKLAIQAKEIERESRRNVVNTVLPFAGSSTDSEDIPTLIRQFSLGGRSQLLPTRVQIVSDARAGSVQPGQPARLVQNESRLSAALRESLAPDTLSSIPEYRPEVGGNDFEDNVERSGYDPEEDMLGGIPGVPVDRLVEAIVAGDEKTARKLRNELAYSDSLTGLTLSEIKKKYNQILPQKLQLQKNSWETIIGNVKREQARRVGKQLAADVVDAASSAPREAPKTGLDTDAFTELDQELEQELPIEGSGILRSNTPRKRGPIKLNVQGKKHSKTRQVDMGVGYHPIFIFNDYEEMKSEAEIVRGIIDAGNDNPKLKGYLKRLLTYLHDHGQISLTEYNRYSHWTM